MQHAQRHHHARPPAATRACTLAGAKASTTGAACWRTTVTKQDGTAGALAEARAEAKLPGKPPPAAALVEAAAVRHLRAGEEMGAS